jgi:hypothetical protein
MRQQFEDLNAQLIEARKTIQERDRILSLMASIDRQLAERRRELSLSVTQLKYEKRDMQALEGLSLESLYYTLLGHKEEQLEKETAEYLGLKMTTEKCRLTIASLQTQLQHFEAELAVLADCEEEYEAVKQQQLEFLTSLGNSDSQQLSELSDKLAQSRIVQQQLNRVLGAGNQAIKTIEEIQVSSVNKAVRLAPALQDSLDNYQNELKAMAFHYSSPLRVSESANDESSYNSPGKAGTALILAGLLLALADPLDLNLFIPSFSSSNQSKWLVHVRNLRGQILKKTDILADRLDRLNDEIDRNQKRVEKLVAAMWQPAYFVEIQE